MKVKTNVKAGGLTLNRSETTAKAEAPRTIRVRTGVKVGLISSNRSEALRAR